MRPEVAKDTQSQSELTLATTTPKWHSHPLGPLPPSSHLPQPRGEPPPMRLSQLSPASHSQAAPQLTQSHLSPDPAATSRLVSCLLSGPLSPPPILEPEQVFSTKYLWENST